MTNATLQVPSRDAMADNKAIVSNPWQKFFELIKKLIDPLGVEKTFTLVNNQSGAADITGLSFDSDTTRYVVIEYFVQRITTGGGAVELTEGGALHAYWQETSAAWAIAQGVLYGDDAGITFTITAAGKVQYTTTNAGGTASVSRINYRVRSLVG